ncbi:MAG: hypothetical protein GY754_18785 [bacterium]|nr:hypothetical protein [bacterium]MCP4133019.1 hypothetical protein [bacterium]
MGNTINITIKLFSGIEKELGIDEYDASDGLSRTVSEGARLGGVFKKLGLRKLSDYAFFRAGERLNRWTRLKDGDEVSCLRPSGGG